MASDELPDDVPEADALEQRRAVDDDPDAAQAALATLQGKLD